MSSFWQNLKDKNFLKYANKDIVKLTGSSIDDEVFKPVLGKGPTQTTEGEVMADRGEVASQDTSAKWELVSEKAFEWANWVSMIAPNNPENPRIWFKKILPLIADTSITYEQMNEKILEANEEFNKNSTQEEKDYLSEFFTQEQFQFTTMKDQKSDNTFRLYEAYQMLLMEF